MKSFTKTKAGKLIIGAVLFGLGRKLPWMHAVFHICVVLGSVLQLITILFYVL